MAAVVSPVVLAGAGSDPVEGDAQDRAARALKLGDGAADDAPGSLAAANGQDRAVAEVADPLRVRDEAEGRHIHKDVAVSLSEDIQKFAEAPALKEHGRVYDVVGVGEDVPVGKVCGEDAVLQLLVVGEIMTESPQVLAVLAFNLVLLDQDRLAHVTVDKDRLFTGERHLFPQAHRDEALAFIGFGTDDHDLTDVGPEKAHIDPETVDGLLDRVREFGIHSDDRFRIHKCLLLLSRYRLFFLFLFLFLSRLLPVAHAPFGFGFL